MSVFLLVSNSQMQRSKYLVMAQEIAGGIFSLSGEVESYFHLRKENEVLNQSLSELEMQIALLEERIENLSEAESSDWIGLDSVYALAYEYTSSKVVYNNVLGLDKYITIRKGSNDGITPDMGVVSGNGIVGVIMEVTPNFSKVIPVLNPKFQLSCKLKKNNYFGPLTWDGKDPRFVHLKELPRHADFQIGDTIVTSGYSAIFPAGFPVGTVVDSEKQRNDNYTSLKIQLFTDFTNLSNVRIVNNTYREEQKNLQQAAN